jgi:hypothetical protein
MDAKVLRHRTFDKLRVGDTASLVRIVGRDDIDLFAKVSGDLNPSHLDTAFAATGLYGHVVAHGPRARRAHSDRLNEPGRWIEDSPHVRSLGQAGHGHNSPKQAQPKLFTHEEPVSSSSGPCARRQPR